MTRAVIALLPWRPSRSRPSRGRRQRASPLVYLRDIDASIRQDMRYAGSDNFTDRPLLRLRRAGMHAAPRRRAGAESVQAELAAADLSLKVYDCYRPTWRRCRHGGVVARQRRSGYVAVLSGAGPRQVVRARLHRRTIRRIRAASRSI